MTPPLDAQGKATNTTVLTSAPPLTEASLARLQRSLSSSRVNTRDETTQTCRRSSEVEPKSEFRVQDQGQAPQAQTPSWAFSLNSSQGRKWENQTRPARRRWRRFVRRRDAEAWKIGITEISRLLNIRRKDLPLRIARDIGGGSHDSGDGGSQLPQPLPWDFFAFEDMMHERAKLIEPQIRNRALQRPVQSDLKWTESIWSEDSVSTWQSRLRYFHRLLPDIMRLPHIARVHADLAKKRPLKLSRRYDPEYLDRRDRGTMLLRWLNHKDVVDRLLAGQNVEEDEPLQGRRAGTTTYEAITYPLQLEDDNDGNSPGGLVMPGPVKFNHGIELQKCEEEAIQQAMRPVSPVSIHSLDMGAFTQGPSTYAPPSDKRAEGLPDGFPPHRIVNGVQEMASYMAKAEYIVSLGGKPAPDIKYGIVIIPIGEESLFIRSGPEDLATTELRDEIYAKSRQLRRQDEFEAPLDPDIPSDYADSEDNAFLRRHLYERKWNPVKPTQMPASSQPTQPPPPPPAFKESIGIPAVVEWSDDEEQSLPNCYAHICRVPRFQGYSPEELRLAHWERDRRKADQIKKWELMAGLMNEDINEVKLAARAQSRGSWGTMLDRDLLGAGVDTVDRPTQTMIQTLGDEDGVGSATIKGYANTGTRISSNGRRRGSAASSPDSIASRYFTPSGSVVRDLAWRPMSTERSDESVRSAPPSLPSSRTAPSGPTTTPATTASRPPSQRGQAAPMRAATVPMALAPKNNFGGAMVVAKKPSKTTRVTHKLKGGLKKLARIKS